MSGWLDGIAGLLGFFGTREAHPREGWETVVRLGNGAPDLKQLAAGGPRRG